RPDQPLSVTEYGAGGATTIHTDDVLGGPPDSRGRAQPEEYESYIHEKNWATLAATPYLWGTWLWNSFDFATTIRREGDADDINTKGLVTYDRRIRKDAYYFYKANWTATPTVHVTGRRYTERAYRVTDVRVYSNAATTELVVNGKSQGTLTDCPGKICLWKAVRLAPGENLVAASGRFGNTPVEDRVTWNLSPDAAQAFRIDSGALVAGHAAGKRFGSDAFFEGGVSGTTTRPADYGVAAVKAPIAGTADPELAATFRRGDFSYRLPLDNGAYDVTLTFVEPSAGPGERVFDVLANGKRVLGDLDIASTGRMTAVQKHFPVQVRDGRLELRFRPSKGEAIVSAIEVSRPNGR
ncbi:MAG: malectin domain-containing carbohydrate-binding protein, partial [Rhizorhabdus sp.]